MDYGILIYNKRNLICLKMLYTCSRELCFGGGNIYLCNVGAFCIIAFIGLGVTFCIYEHILKICLYSFRKCPEA